MSLSLSALTLRITGLLSTFDGRKDTVHVSVLGSMGFCDFFDYVHSVFGIIFDSLLESVGGSVDAKPIQSQAAMLQQRPTVCKRLHTQALSHHAAASFSSQKGVGRWTCWNKGRQHICCCSMQCIIGSRCIPTHLDMSFGMHAETALPLGYPSRHGALPCVFYYGSERRLDTSFERSSKRSQTTQILCKRLLHHHMVAQFSSWNKNMG